MSAAARAPTTLPTALGRSAAIGALLLALTPVSRAYAGATTAQNMLTSASNAMIPQARQNLASPPLVTDYGAKGDVTWASCNAAISSGAAALACPGAGWAASDVGKHIEVPGAGGVIYQNGVQEVPVTAAGTGYTSVPGCSVGGSGGSGATCQANMSLVSATVNAGGFGCAGSSATLVVQGGAGNLAEVTAVVSAGAVTGISAVLFAGSYTALPGTSAVAAAGGNCSGVTLNLTWGVGSVAVTANGSGYPAGGGTTAALSDGGGSGATLGSVGIGSSVNTLATTIAAFTDGGHVTLGANAGAALSGVSTLVTWGTDSTAGFNNALAAGRKAVWVPSPPQNPLQAPTGVYFVCNTVMHSGNTLLGAAHEGYANDLYNTTSNRPILLAEQGCTSILNPSGTNGVRIEGIELDGNNTGADCIAADATGTHVNLTLVTAIRCNYGFGTSGQYSHIARIVNSVFAQNQIGIGSLIDSKMFGGSASANGGDGILQGNGASANEFVGVRVEWNQGYGFDCFGCATNQLIGGNFDRNYRAAIRFGYGAAEGGQCANNAVEGTALSRNARNSKSTGGDRSAIYIDGSCTGLTIRPGANSIGQDDDGSNALSPQYLLETAPSLTLDTLTVHGANGIVGAGVVAGGTLLNSTPTNFTLAGSPGIQSLINTGYPKIGGSFGAIGSPGYAYLSQLSLGNIAGSGGSASGVLTWPGVPNTFHKLVLFLKVSGSDVTTGAAMNALLPLTIGRTASNSTVTVGTSIAGFALGATVGTSATTVTLAVSNIAPDGSSFTLTVNNTGSDTLEDVTTTLLAM